jgi:shikimate kinase
MGKQLAHRLGRAFVDTDHEIEKALGKSVRQIFQQEGEAFFRILEQEKVQEMRLLRDAVISLGGGTLEFGRNLETVLESGKLVWLDTPMDLLIKRLKNDNKRPLLRNPDGSMRTEDSLRAWLEALYEKRRQRYLSAHIRFVPTGNMEDDVPHLVRLLQEAAI